MSKFNCQLLIIISILFIISCEKDTKVSTEEAQKTVNKIVVNTQAEPKIPIMQPEDFIPEGMVKFEQILGDLNNDGLEDCVLVVKGTEKENIVEDEYRGSLDRNRRGIIILLKNQTSYMQVLQNLNCFSSENEDGGVYYSPDLWLEIEDNKLYISYAHGRYGYWKYTFRKQSNDLELIGYDSSDNHGPLIQSKISINFLTGKLVYDKNINVEATTGHEIFKTTKRTIVNQNIKLSEIKDFDDLEVYDYEALNLQ